MALPHSYYMQHALRLATRGLGQTAPNPTVGAVIIKDGAILGTGTTAHGGRPHAETIALEQAGENARGATLYVTLEPCAHHGQTPPCTQAIINAGIKHVVAACRDPNPKVAGKGIAQLREAGIEVTEKICEKEALALNAGFFSVITRGRPFITLKLATSLDGKIADSKGNSQWITGEASRQRGHLLRAESDAILTGIGTVLADNPRLTCRIPGREMDSPQRIVMDSQLRTPPKAKLLPAWVITSADQQNTPKAETLAKAGATILTVGLEKNQLSLHGTVMLLADKGITRLIVEAGGTLATAFLQAGLVDCICWFRAPLIMGEKGMAAINSQSLPLGELARYKLQETQRLGDDSLSIYDCGAA